MANSGLKDDEVPRGRIELRNPETGSAIGGEKVPPGDVGRGASSKDVWMLGDSGKTTMPLHLDQYMDEEVPCPLCGDPNANTWTNDEDPEWTDDDYIQEHYFCDKCSGEWDMFYTVKASFILLEDGTCLPVEDS